MSEPFDKELVVWMIQRKSIRGKWRTIPYMIRRTRSEAIDAFKDMYHNGDKIWRRQRNAGDIRCVCGLLYYKSS